MKIRLVSISLMLVFNAGRATAQQSFKEDLKIRLLSPISTKTNKAGDAISAQVTVPERWAGARIQGKIRACTAARKLGGKSELSLSFVTMIHNGMAYSVQTEVKGFENSKGAVGVDDEGTVIKHNRVLGKALILGGIGAATGAAVGGAKGAAIGGAAGVAGAFVIKMAASAPNITFNAGSIVSVHVTARLKSPSAQ